MVEQPVAQEDLMPRMRSYLSRAGYHTSLESVSDEVRGVADEIYVRALSLAAPFVCRLDAAAESLPAGYVPEELRAARGYSIIVCTIGSAIDGCIDDYFRAGEALRGTLLDAWGSEAVETLTDNTDRRLRGIHGEGSRRYSPGYGGYDIRINANLLDYVKAHSERGLELSADRATGILSPRKSVICIIGWDSEVKG